MTPTVEAILSDHEDRLKALEQALGRWAGQVDAKEVEVVNLRSENNALRRRIHELRIELCEALGHSITSGGRSCSCGKVGITA